MKHSKGLSLIEIIVTVALFAVIGVLVTRSIALSMKGSQKSDTSLKVREDVNYALSVMERQLRGAQEIISSCDGSSLDNLSYYDALGDSTFFSCEVADGDGYLASGSARLTSTETTLTACSFTCTGGSRGTPALVEVKLTVDDTDFVTKINLRSY